MRSSIIKRCRSVASSTATPSTASSRSPTRTPARSAAPPSTTWTISIARDHRWQRARSNRDADLRAPHTAFADQGGDDRPGRLVDGHRQSEPETGKRGVDADNAAATVDQRAARVSGIEGGVGLDDVLDQSLRTTPPADRQRAPETADDTGRDRAREAVRIADRDDELAHAQALGVSQERLLQVAGVRPQDCQVGQLIGAHDGGAGLAAIGEAGRDADRALDDMGRGEQEAVLSDDHRAAAPLGIAPARTADDAEVRDARRQGVGDLDDCTRVGVQRRLGVVLGSQCVGRAHSSRP
jgi:hypothetical protein